MRWDWQIGRVRPSQRTGARAVDIYDIDGLLTTRADVRAIHRSWQAATRPHPRLICYIVDDRVPPNARFAAVKFDVDLDGRLFYPCPNGT